jgi:hypothetical protein
MTAPARVTIPTCIGCWSMRLFAECEPSCNEQKLELVHAEAYDELSAELAEARALIAAVTQVAQHFTDAAGGRSEAVYRSAQELARAALRAHPPPATEQDEPEPTEVRTAWWCPECGAIEALKECLGICVWRPLEWVSRERYAQLEEQGAGQRERARRARALLATLAHVTPRPGHWEQSLGLIAAQATAAALWR